MTEDAALVGRALEGDTAAFEELVRRYTRAAFAVALGVVKEPSDAEDVCQDAFVRALERLEDCRDPARFGAWFLRIVRNRAHSVRRYLGVRQAAPLDSVSVRSDVPGPQRDAERRELRSDLQQALLELPEGTVRAHLHHARKALRENDALRRSTEG
jgi:RNA polymerase sigma-70 factor (ECF subfamily)